jgi:Transposase DDE domain group 1
MTGSMSCTGINNSRCSTFITMNAASYHPRLRHRHVAPEAVLLRTGMTPSDVEIRSHLRRTVRRIRTHWPDTRLTIRGDGHYGRPEVLA